MPRVPVLDTSDIIVQRQLPAHLDPVTMANSTVASRARANHTGTQVAATISDLTEAIHDVVATLITAGTGIGLVYNDTANSLTISATGGGTGGATDPEVVRDTVAAALVAGTNVTITSDDTANTITISAAGGAAGTTDPEVVRDTMATALVAGTNVTITPNDNANTITVAAVMDPEIVRDTIATALVAGSNVTITADDAGDTITIAATAGTTAPTDDGIFTPAQVLNIGSAAGQNHFKVQVAPTGASAYVEHTQDEIQSGYSESPYFYTTTENRVHLQARVDAPTTSGSAYSRSELRELDQSGANMAFNARTGTHRILGTSRITHQAPNKPETVIAQLHDGNNDRIAIRTQAISSSAPTVVALSIRINGSTGGTGYHETVAYSIGREFDWKIEGVNDLWKVYIDDMTTPKSTTPAAGLSSSSTSWYFKAGCYNQTNTSTDTGSEYGAVELSKLMHWHTGWTTNQAFPTLVAGSTVAPFSVTPRTSSTLLATTTTRPPSPSVGQEIYESDTQTKWLWTGSKWLLLTKGEVAYNQTSVTFGTGTSEMMRLSTPFVARTGQRYRIYGHCSPLSDTAAAYTLARLRWDTVGTGITGTLVNASLKDHRTAGRAESISPMGEFVYGGTDGATIYAKLTMDTQGGVGTDSAASYGPTRISVDTI